MTAETIIAPLQKAIQQVVEEETKDAIAKAQRALEQNIRSRTADIAARVCEYMTFERTGTQIKITVDFKHAQT